MTTAEQNYFLLQEIEANRRFLLMAYQQNPELLKSAEARIIQLLETIPARGSNTVGDKMKQHGATLIELIMFIVIVSVSVAGILLVMNQVTGRSADPLFRKQALAVAESMLEEVQLQDLPSGVACAGTLGADAPRTSAGNVCDYNNYHTTAGILDFSTNANVPGLQGYNIDNVSVTEIPALGGTAITPGSGVQITVAVTGPAGTVVGASGYRLGK